MDRKEDGDGKRVTYLVLRLVLQLERIRGRGG